jgi:hypothetical protein
MIKSMSVLSRLSTPVTAGCPGCTKCPLIRIAFQPLVGCNAIVITAVNSASHLSYEVHFKMIEGLCFVWCYFTCTSTDDEGLTELSGYAFSQPSFRKLEVPIQYRPLALLHTAVGIEPTLTSIHWWRGSSSHFNLQRAVPMQEPV